MAARHSRYREPPVALPADARGRTSSTTPLRARPEITGTFRHIVAEGERLDQIAYGYYQEPTIWWRICDANPEFLSPLSLLGQESVSTTRFPARGTETGPAPDWTKVKRALTEIVGVEYVGVQEDVEYVTVMQTVDVAPLGPREVPIVKERFRRSLVVRYNCTTASADAIVAAIKAAGHKLEAPVETGRVGREIVIPPLGAI